MGPPSTLVERIRLIEAIDKALERPVLMIHAPSGYGKTTLLRQWKQQTNATVIHLECRQTDNAPSRFLSRLLAEARAVGLDVPLDTQTPTDAVTALAETMAGARGTFVIVLDDVGIIDNQEVLELVNILLEELPANARFVGSGRTLPRLHILRRFLDEDLLLLGRDDLAFTDGEAADFLHRRGYARNDAAASGIRTRANGWIAGLKLLTHPTRHTDEGSRELADLTSDASLDRYVEEEMLAPLELEVRAALLMSSTLPYLSVPLWEHLFPGMDAAKHLAKLADEFALITSHTKSCGSMVYSMHQLLGESLERIMKLRLQYEQRRHVATKAASWFLDRGENEQALDVVIRAEVWDLAVPVMERVIADYATRDQSRTILHWVQRLPEALVLDNDQLAYWMIFASYCVGEVSAANDWLVRVEPRWRRSHDRTVLGRWHACRGMNAAFTSDFRRQVEESRIGYELLPEHCYVERLHALTGILGDAMDGGNLDQIERLLTIGFAIRQHLPSQQIWWDAHVALSWPQALASAGRLEEAMCIYRDKVGMLHGDLLRHQGKLMSRLAAIALEQNDLEEALRLTSHLEFAGTGRFTAIYWYPEAWLIRARILAAAGRESDALAELDRAAEFARSRGLFRIHALVETLRSLWSPRSSVPPSKSMTLETTEGSGLIVSQVFGEIDPAFADVYWHLARHEHRAALALAHRILDASLARHRVDVEIRALVLVAACHTLSDGERGLLRAAKALRRAVTLGRPGRFIQSFLVPNMDLTPVLDRIHVNPEDLAYVSLIREAMLDADQGGRRQRLYLSVREREVLRMLDAGASNQDIAETLFISVNTVKKHLVRINRKLGTANRTAAVLSAKRAGLFQEPSE